MKARRGGAGRGTPSPPPTCSSNDRGEMLKPCSAAGKWAIFTSATSSLGLSRARGSVREAPSRTSPKHRKGDLQKWLRDRTGGEAAASSAAEFRGLADGLRSVGLTSQLRPARRVAMAASRRRPEILAPCPQGCSGAGPRPRPLGGGCGGRESESAPPLSFPVADTPEKKRNKRHKFANSKEEQQLRPQPRFKLLASTNGRARRPPTSSQGQSMSSSP